MNDKYLIDSHKLIYHPIRVSKWMDAFAQNDQNKLKSVYPIYIEISPVGACNHRCTFCAVDYIGYQNIKWETNALKDRLQEMANKGIKSVMYAGEGEPLLHKDIGEILEHTKNVGIDCSLTTNFVNFNKKNADKILQNSSWIKVSLNAGSKETYANIHRTKEDDFDKVIENLKNAIKIRNENNYTCTIGVQILLLPENKDEIIKLANISKEIGVDYIVAKPYSQHLFSDTKIYKDIDYTEMKHLVNDFEKLSTENFSAIFRENTINKLTTGHDYKKCYSTPYFWAHIMADGSVYGCSAYLKQSKFCYGNLNENTFEEIWEGEKRKKSIIYVKEELNISNCRTNCRMDEINRYLWRLQNPNTHDNFI